MTLAFALYFSILLAIGLTAHRKSQSELDFIVGGRGLNYWLTALSAHASDMSAWLFMSFPVMIFLNGMVGCWIALGLIVGMFLNWQFIAPKLRRQTEDLDSLTLSTFFEKRFQDTTHWIRLTTAALTLLFMTHYLSAGLMATGLLLESAFGIEYLIGTAISTFIVIAYTYFGGFITIAWTDLFQGVFLLLVILIVPLIGLGSINGFQAIETAAQTQRISLNLFPEFSIYWLFTTFLTAAGWGLGYFGLPHILTKFMGIQDASELRKSKYLGMTWQILALSGAALIGLVAIAFFPAGLEDPQLMFVDMVESLFHPFVAGFILCAILAANISTMDSQLLVCASVVTEDLYRIFVNKEADSKTSLHISRIGVVCVAVISFLIAYERSSTIMGSVSYSWAGLGCTFGPIVVMSLYSKSANKFGILAGIVVGGLLAAAWPLLNPYICDYEVLATIPGFLLSIITILIVSKWTKA